MNEHENCNNCGVTIEEIGFCEDCKKIAKYCPICYSYNSVCEQGICHNCGAVYDFLKDPAEDAEYLYIIKNKEGYYLEYYLETDIEIEKTFSINELFKLEFNEQVKSYIRTYLIEKKLFANLFKENNHLFNEIDFVSFTINTIKMYYSEIESLINTAESYIIQFKHYQIKIEKC
jgi:hypothetical protein